MYRNLIGLTLSCALLLLCAGTASAADSISVKFGADPTEEVPLPISVTWASAASVSAYVTVKPAGPIGCAANYEADDPTSSDVLYRESSGASTNSTFDEPGNFVLCGYLQRSSSDTVPAAVTGPIALTVRAAKATLGLTVPPRVDAAKPFKLTAAVTSELRREVFITIKPVGGRGCEATYALDEPNSSDVAYRESTQGTQTLNLTSTAPQTNARYLLCGYVQEGSGDPTPEATASVEFLVGPDPCVVAKDALAAANRALHVAEGSVNRNRASWRRYSSAARAAHGARRRVLKSLSVRAKSRYKSAVRRRAAARARVAGAQSGVTSACGA